jgi:hypothetical protein
MVSGALAAMAALAASVPTAGQAPRGAAPKDSKFAQKTAWGDPDIQGVWRSEGGVAFERPVGVTQEVLSEAEVAARQKRAEERQAVALAGKATNRGFRAQENYNSIFNTSEEKVRINPRTSAIIDPPDGRLPAWTTDQVKLWQEREKFMSNRGEGETWEDVNVGGRCVHDYDTPKVPAWGLGFGGENTAYGGRDAAGENLAITNGDGIDPGASAGGNRRILQTPGYVTIITEEGGEVLIVPTDGRPVPNKIRQWGGIARGKWEGNTFAVTFTNVMYQQPHIPNAGFPLYPGTGETLTVVERFTRIDANRLEWKYTVTDPKVYVRPYTAMHMLEKDDDYKFGPALCHENNRDMGGLLANQRSDEHQSLENGLMSVEMRKPRVEKLYKQAQENAAKRGSQ